MANEEEIIQYLSRRRDYYKREEEREERKKHYNPSLIIGAKARKEAFNEAIDYITIYM